MVEISKVEEGNGSFKLYLTGTSYPDVENALSRDDFCSETTRNNVFFWGAFEVSVVEVSGQLFVEIVADEKTAKVFQTALEAHLNT